MAQSERLAVVGRVAASLTHEITRPLATVKFLLETGSQSQDVASADYQRALRDVERIETLLEEFLDFAGAHKPRFALVDVNAIVSDALQFIAGECEQRKMAVEREMGDCPHILGDETMLREAFVNIMLNALEAMSSGGTLSITTRLTLAGGPPPSDAEGVEVFFSDEGPGFSERDLERIFEPFYSTKPKGTGMGMTIVKRAVDLHGGSLRLLNREEGGAIVITFLPLPTPEQQQVLERLEAQLTPRRLPSIA
jgi:signal transduction histidine kinase